MATPELMSIGVFAKRAGLTASALRFYDDAGLLLPERVDPLTGYRLYAEAQLMRAAALRRLRKVGMPLPSSAGSSQPAPTKLRGWSTNRSKR